jgi:hypothetical protein
MVKKGWGMEGIRCCAMVGTSVADWIGSEVHVAPVSSTPTDGGWEH